MKLLVILWLLICLNHNYIKFVSTTTTEETTNEETTNEETTTEETTTEELTFGTTDDTTHTTTTTTSTTTTSTTTPTTTTSTTTSTTTPTTTTSTTTSTTPTTTTTTTSPTTTTTTTTSTTTTTTTTTSTTTTTTSTTTSPTITTTPPSTFETTELVTYETSIKSSSSQTSTSTTTRSTSTTQTLKPTDVLVFECDFSKDCNYVIDGSAFSYFNVNSSLSIPGSSYTIPDYLSSIKPTVNNRTCIFPFNYAGNEYYYCTKIDNKFQCKVDANDQFDDCSYDSNGRFIQSHSLNGNQYQSSISFNLKVNDLGKYRFKFASIMFCYGDQQCDRANDFISIKTVFAGSSVNAVEHVKVKLENVTENKWQQFSFEFDVYLQIQKNLSIVVTIGREKYYEKLAYVGVDDLNLYFVEKFKDTKKDRTLLIVLLSVLIPALVIIVIISLYVVYRKKKTDKYTQNTQYKLNNDDIEINTF